MSESPLRDRGRTAHEIPDHILRRGNPVRCLAGISMSTALRIIQGYADHSGGAAQALNLIAEARKHT